MRIIIHAGMQKTGSSSLQHYLYSSRERLAAIGVVYPDFGHRAHWLLSEAFKRSSPDDASATRLATRKLPLSLEDFRLELAALLRKAATDQLIILSNEGLCREPRTGRLIEFIRAVRPEAAVRVLAYIRDPVSHFPSSTQQLLRTENDATLFPSIWLSQHCLRGFYLADAVGAELELRVFSPKTLVEGDVIEDFRDFVRRHAGFELPPNPDPRPRNASHSAAGCAVLALRDLAPAHPFPTKSRKPFFRQLRQADEALGFERLLLPERFAQAIAANNHEAWNLLVDLTEHDAATRETLKLAPAVMPPGVEAENSATWTVAGLRQAHVEQLLAGIRTDLAPRPADKLSGWLVAAVNSTTKLHGVRLGG